MGIPPSDPLGVVLWYYVPLYACSSHCTLPKFPTQVTLEVPHNSTIGSTTSSGVLYKHFCLPGARYRLYPLPKAFNRYPPTNYVKASNILFVTWRSIRWIPPPLVWSMRLGIPHGRPCPSLRGGQPSICWDALL